VNGKQALGLFAFGLVCWCGGGAVAYRATREHFKLKYEEDLVEEIAKARKFFARRYKEDEYSDPNKLAKEYEGDEVSTKQDELEEATEELRYAERHPADPVEPETIEKSIFTEDDRWDWAKEQELRVGLEMRRRPYIIHHDEFMQNEKEYEQATLTYFEGDDVLADDKDEYIDDADAVVGDDNLQHFGYGSKDNNVVYIRNPRLKMEYEVLHHSGKYAQEILGFIEHSDRPGKSKIRRFRE
jgi:hypothetical protein